MTRLTAIDPKTATGKAKELLDGVQAAIGVTPNLLRTFANSPAALQAYLGFSGALKGGRLGAALGEQIALAVAGENGCEYCASAHTLMGRGAGVADAELTANLDGRSADPKVQAVIDFARAVVRTKGRVEDAQIESLRAHGLDDGDITEIVAHVAINFFTNTFNHVARTDIDFPVVHLPQAARAA